jgi:hypothetical protein
MSLGTEILAVVTAIFLLASTCYIITSLVYETIKLYFGDADKIDFHLFMSSLITGIALLLLCIVGTI